ncbi:MAG: YceI family protein [Paracoccaceae bacterium]
MFDLKNAALLCALTCATSASADSWTLDGASSRLAFGSIKNSYNGEVHNFQDLSGTVDDSGAVSIDIDLASVNTNIDIRNERMVEHVFKNIATANLTAQIDMAAVKDMDVGASSVMEVDGALSFLGQSTDITTNMFVARLSEEQVMVTTNDMLMLDLDDLDVNPGIDMLKDLAGLDSITRATPITVRLMFDMDKLGG